MSARFGPPTEAAPRFGPPAAPAATPPAFGPPVDAEGPAIAPNPVRAALLQQRQFGNAPLSLQGEDVVQQTGARVQPNEDLTAMPQLLAGALANLPISEESKETLAHPFDTLGFATRRIGQAFETVFGPVVGELVGRATEQAVVGTPAGDLPELHEAAAAAGRAALHVPTDMASAVVGDPTMLALTVTGMATPAVALAPFVHALPGAYFAAEGAAGLAPGLFGRTAEERAQPSPFDMMSPEALRTLSSEQKTEAFRNFFGQIAMVGLPLVHGASEMAKAGENLRVDEPLGKMPQIIDPNLPYNSPEGAVEILRTKAVEAGIPAAEFEASMVPWYEHAKTWEKMTNYDQGHLWGLLAENGGDLAGAEAALHQAIGVKGVEALDRFKAPAERALPKLRDAEALEKRGVDPGIIKERTGWERGIEGKWRFEMSDRSMLTLKMEPNEWTPETKLIDVIDHPELFAAYPELADVKMSFDPAPKNARSRGYFDEKTNTICVTMNAVDQAHVERTIAHEVQHWVQMKEDFARGGSAITAFLALDKKEQVKIFHDLAARLEEEAASHTLTEKMAQTAREKLGSGLDKLKGERAKAAAAEAEALASGDMIGAAAATADYQLAVDRALTGIGYKPGNRFREGMRKTINAILNEPGDGVTTTIMKARSERLAREALVKEINAGVKAGDMAKMAGELNTREMINDLYRRMAGEADARSTAERIHMTREQLSQTVRPYGVKEYERIISMGPRTEAIPSPLNQLGEAGVKGQMTALKDGRMLIELFKGADISTLLHESAHVFRRSLYLMRDLAQEEAKPELIKGLATLEEWAGVKDGKWDVKAEERWATGVEQYLRTGEAPNARLKPVFSQFRDWLRGIYDDGQAKQLATFSPEVKEFFEKYVIDKDAPARTEGARAALRRMKAEDRAAYEAALALRDLPAARQKLEDRLTGFQKWIDMAREERELLGSMGPGDALQRTRAGVKALVRQLRETAGETFPDQMAEWHEIDRLAEKYYASPKLLTDYVEQTIVPRIEQLSKAILTAEATYKAKVEAIAMRGRAGDSWGFDPVKDAAKAELLNKIKMDVEAAKTDLAGVDGTRVYFNGQRIDPAAVMTELIAGVRKTLALEGKTPPEQLNLIEQEAARLMEGGMDATTEAAVERFRTPWAKAIENFKPILLGVRAAARQVFDPMSALDPYTYDPNRTMNKILRRLGLDEKKPFRLTEDAMRAAIEAFRQADGELNYWDKTISPFWLDAIHKAFPDLKDRQLMSGVRDFGKLDVKSMEEKYAARYEAAKEATRKIDKRTDPDGYALARQQQAIAFRRMQRAKDHVGIDRTNLSPRMAAILAEIGDTFDALQDIAVREGLWSPEAFRNDYLPRIYKNADVARAQRFFRESSLLGGPNKHGFHRAFETLVEAYAFEGLKPATLDLATLVDQYGRSLTESIQKRRLVNELQRIAPDLFEWVELERNPAPKKFMDISPYVSRAGIRAEGQPATARFYAHESIGVLLKNLSAESAWDRYYPLKKAKEANAYLKRIQLGIDLYHLWQVTRVAAASGVYGPAEHLALPLWSVTKELGLLDPTHPKHALAEEFIKHGLDLSSGDWARRQMHAELDMEVGKISRGAKLYHILGEGFEGTSRFMWERYVPALKILVATRHLERLMENPRTSHLSREALVRAAATVANDKFGSSVQSLKGRSKTLNDTLSMAFLAPQWLETRFRNVLGLGKMGAEGALWRDYWLGEGVMDLARGVKTPVAEIPKRWATGYVVQGMILSALGNAMVAALWPEGDKKEKAAEERGANWFTRTIIPAQDKRGVPLHVSPFATMDYFTAFLEDLTSVAPALRWYRGRQAPLLRAVSDIHSGVDFASRPTRPGFFSLETVGQTVDAMLPWFHNILWGSVGGAVTADDPAFGTFTGLARMTGGHTASSFMPQVSEKAEFFRTQSQVWDKQAKTEWQKWYYAEPVIGDMMLAAARFHVWNHNRRLDAFIKEVQANPRMQATLGRAAEQLGTYHIQAPERRR